MICSDDEKDDDDRDVDEEEEEEEMQRIPVENEDGHADMPEEEGNLDNQTPSHAVETNSEDEDYTTDLDHITSCVGAAQAPEGYRMLDTCRTLDTGLQVQELIGSQILHAWDNKHRQGGFERRVHGRCLNAREINDFPSACSLCHLSCQIHQVLDN